MLEYVCVCVLFFIVYSYIYGFTCAHFLIYNQPIGHILGKHRHKKPNQIHNYKALLGGVGMVWLWGAMSAESFLMFFVCHNDRLLVQLPYNQLLVAREASQPSNVRMGHTLTHALVNHSHTHVYHIQHQ